MAFIRNDRGDFLQNTQRLVETECYCCLRKTFFLLLLTFLDDPGQWAQFPSLNSDLDTDHTVVPVAAGSKHPSSLACNAEPPVRPGGKLTGWGWTIDQLFIRCTEK